MNKIKIASLVLVGVIGFAAGIRPPNPVVEIQLSLMQQTTDGSAKNLALGISIINHSDSDIYIPDFEFIVSYKGIHYYQEEAGQWKELNIITHDYYKPYQPGTRTKEGVFIDHMELPKYKENKLSRENEGRYRMMKNQQDSFLQAYVRQIDGLKDYRSFTDREPLFLKSGETLLNYRVYALDYFLDKKNDYKILFSTDSSSLQFRSGDSTVSVKGRLFFPEKISGYYRVFPKIIQSNVIYYSTR